MLKIFLALVHNIIFWIVILVAFFRLMEIFYFQEVILSDVHIAIVALFSLFIFLMPYVFLRQCIPFDARAIFFILMLFGYGGLAVVLQTTTLQEKIDLLGFSSHIFPRTRWIETSSWLGLGLCCSRARLDSSLVIVLILFSLLTLLVGTNVTGIETINYDTLKSELNIQGATHLMISDNIILVGYAVFVLAPPYLRILIFWGLAILLFIAGGRSAFIFGMISLLIFMFFSDSGTRKFRKIMFILVIIVTAGIYVFLAEYSYKDDFVEMFFSDGLKDDGSVVARSTQFTDGLTLLWSQFWYGNLGAIIEKFGLVGSTMHNFLSAWQYFGFPFFLIFVAAWIEAIRRVGATYTSHSDYLLVQFMVILTLYSVMSLIFSKSATFWLAWFSLGIALGQKPTAKRLSDKYYKM